MAGAATAQQSYDAARDLEEALRRSRPISRACGGLYGAALAYARGTIRRAEGIDRPRKSLERAGLRRAVHARARLRAIRLRCAPGPAVSAPSTAVVAPRDDSAFFGLVVVASVAGAEEAGLYADGRRVAEARPSGPTIRFRLRLPPGRYDLEVRQLRAGVVVARAAARRVWLLPSSARSAVGVLRRDGNLQRRLGTLGASTPGYAAFWVHDLRTGRYAGWNADARFPAASTVKLAVLAEALRRFDPWRSGAAYDIAAVARWSSNLAANRLTARLGGPAAVTAALARLGARSSTYTGDYRIGTARHVDAPRRPPMVSARVTTARDIGRMLQVLHAAAAGDRRAQRAARLGTVRARYALGVLLSFEAAGNNVGARAAVPLPAPIAQKNGWTRSIRHTGAIVYGRTAPRIVVVLGYREPSFARAAALALVRRVVAIVRPAQ